MEIRHDTDRKRFVAEVDGKEGTLTYERVDDGTLDYRSTFVPEELRGDGIGAKLVLHALDYARENDFEVVPSCPFVGKVIEEHPEYEDLIAERD